MLASFALFLRMPAAKATAAARCVRTACCSRFVAHVSFWFRVVLFRSVMLGLSVRLKVRV